MEQNVNYGYTIGYVFTIALGFFNLGYCYSYFNTVTKIMHGQYVENDMFVVESRDLFNSIVSALIPFGAIFGAPLGGALAGKGRRFALMSITSTFIVGCILTTIFNFFTLLAGRFIMGVCIGGYFTVVPLFITELSPKSIAGPLGVVTQFLRMIAILIAVSLGFMVPYASDEDALTTQIWRYIFGLPIVFSMIQLALFMIVFTHDTPTFYELTNQQEMYHRAMSRLYKNQKFVAVMASLLDEQTVNIAPKKVDLGWGELFTYPNRKPLIVGLLLGTFHQTTGIMFITFFSNDIFSAGQTGPSGELSARVGTFGTGIAGVLAAIAAFMFARQYGRKTILLIGEIVMCLLLAFLTHCAITDKQMFTIVGIVLFVFVFNATFGAILWLYVSEILGAKGISLVAFINLSFTVIIGCGGNLLFKLLSDSGTYFFLFLMQILCIYFIYVYVIETLGHSKDECKKLYFPEEPKELKAKLELSVL